MKTDGRHALEKPPAMINPIAVQVVRILSLANGEHARQLFEVDPGELMYQELIAHRLVLNAIQGNQPALSLVCRLVDEFYSILSDHIDIEGE